MYTILALALLVAYASAVAPLHRNTEPVEGSYIVVFEDNVTSIQLDADLTFIAQAHAVQYEHTYRLALKGFAAKLSPVQLLRVRSHSRVKYVEEDGIARIAVQEQVCTTVPAPSWGLTRVAERGPPVLDGEYSYPNLGAGVDAYIVDTGILTTHVDFGSPTRASFGFKSDLNWPDVDQNGHGTHVASTVGGVRYGVAKGVTLISVKVLGAGGSGTWAGVISGIEFVVRNRQDRNNRPSVANLSLGGGLTIAVNQAATQASDLGIHMFIAAGNSNANAINFSPASADRVYCVGSTDVDERAGAQVDLRSFFSNFGPRVNIWGPGSNIVGAWIGSDTAERTISGTSMATPHVAGVGSLLLSVNPNLNFDALLNTIQGQANNNLIDFSNCPTGQPACPQTRNALVFNGCDS